MTNAREWACGVTHLLSSQSAVDETAELPLADFQRDAAQRLYAMASHWGGALLADAVGLGKTRVLLHAGNALLRDRRSVGDTRAPWCVAPARTHDSWRREASAAGRHDLVLVSYGALSRGLLPDTKPSLLLIDEAHRLRNRDTRRRQNLAAYLGVPTLLSTATPVVNSTRDLHALLELFLDDDDVRVAVGWDVSTAFSLARRGAWDLTELLRLTVVRRTRLNTPGALARPRARLEVLRYTPGPAESWMWENLESAARSLAGGALRREWPPGLFAEHVLRRWESGPDALLDTLRDLATYLDRLRRALRDGRTLDRSTSRTLFGGCAAQEVLPFVYPESRGDQASAEELDTDMALVEALLERAEQAVAEGAGRDACICELASDEEPLLVFTSYQRAAEALFMRMKEALGSAARIGLVTGSRAEVTGIGRTTGTDVLHRFAPRAHGIQGLRGHERITVVVATDCIAEGVNLQDCHRVVLADLPYTPLGVEQRVGRLIRPGAARDEVIIYLPRPDRWVDTLGMRRRLDRKVDAATSVAMRPNVSLGASPPTGSNPLATLARVDHLARDVPVAEAPTGAWSTTDGSGKRWLIVMRNTGSRLLSAAVLSRSGEIVGFLDEALSALAELAWSEEPLERTDVPEFVRSFVDDRDQFLRAASAAPPALELDAPEAVAWKRLCEAELHDGLRAKLLRKLPHGRRSHLRELLATNASPQRLARFARALPEPHQHAGIELVTCLALDSQG